MNLNWYRRKNWLTLSLIIIALLGLLAVAGCGSEPEVETEPRAEAGEGEAEDLPPEPQPEQQEPTQPEVTQPDYAEMAPQEYGVQDVFFDFDRYDLDAEAMATLNANARILREAGVTVLISGHCDERGTIEYNLALGEKRAQAVRDYLVSLRVPAELLRITSYGESKPFAYGHNEEAWAKNRRAHFERP